MNILSEFVKEKRKEINLTQEEGTEETALTLDGKKKKLKPENFKKLGDGLGLNEKQVKGVFNRLFKNKNLAVQWINNSFLSKEYKQMYIALLEERYNILAK